MPWWNRTPTDARRAVAAFADAFFTTLHELDMGKQLSAPDRTGPDVPRWEIHEFAVKAPLHVANPFRDAALVGEFTSPSGQTSVIDGFYDGDKTWRLRFAPDAEGEWRYLLRGEGIEVFQHGQLRCTAPRGHGFIRIHTEFGYEYLRGHPHENRQVHHTDKVRRTAWRIVCAGGYLAAGFNGTIGHSDAWNRIDPSNHYAFVVQDQGAAAQLSGLHAFFVGLPFWRLNPFFGVSEDVVALAELGQIYIVYMPRGGSTPIDLRAAPGPFTARWFNPRTCSFGVTFTVPGDDQRKFDAPDNNDWVMLLTATQ